MTLDDKIKLAEKFSSEYLTYYVVYKFDKDEVNYHLCNENEVQRNPSILKRMIYSTETKKLNTKKIEELESQQLLRTMRYKLRIKKRKYLV